MYKKQFELETKDNEITEQKLHTCIEFEQTPKGVWQCKRYVTITYKNICVFKIAADMLKIIDTDIAGHPTRL